MDQPFVSGFIPTVVGPVPTISCTLTRSDHFGTIKTRCRIGRMNYTVDPGLYAVGRPDAASHVLVTANYKLTFDALRSRLEGQNLWILVLDTKGINVWCAAGKRTFGTAELLERISSTGLGNLVTHRKLILPQLGAPGIAAHEIHQKAGFRVTYGPIKASDLPEFLDNGYKATPEMRLKTFPLSERLVLIPVELVGALETAIFVIPVFFLLSGLGGPGQYTANLMNYGVFAVAALLSALAAGTVLAPALLPWLPGRAFAFKGFMLGLPVALLVMLLRNPSLSTLSGLLESAAWLLLIPAIASYLTMNFTGASTYTSLSGVKKEMRIAVPLQIAAGVLGVIFWFVARFIS